MHSVLEVGLGTDMVRLLADGPADLAAVSWLGRVDPELLEPEARVDLIRAWDRVEAMVAGRKQAALAAVVDATEASGLDGECARHEIGAALRLSPVTAWQQTRHAADLVHRLPATLAALTAGDISVLQATHLAEAVRELPDAAAATVETRVLEAAPEQTLAQFEAGRRPGHTRRRPGARPDRHRRQPRPAGSNGSRSPRR